MITVERASKILTKHGEFTTEGGVVGKISRGVLMKRAMTENERRIASTKYNFLIEEESFAKCLGQYSL